MRATHYALLLLAALIAAGLSCGSTEEQRVLAMPINEVNLAGVQDGTYRGSFTFARFAYVVDVKVEGHRVSAITMVKNRDDKWSQMAATMADSVVRHQRLTVDAVTGATASSRVILKAIELSFKNRISD